ncbi:hypothetical protein ACTXG5_22870 [Mycobacterium sp. Dal123C01]|uniref:hypothetical protein n=1 Tax=Mycobacterium sp. Dal123C01 TaxID=3457577 RepID=UPI00403EECCE
MTIPQVWVSTTTSQIQFDGTGLGDHWQLVGTIDTTEEAEFHKHIQVLLGLRSSRPDAAEFYLSGTPDHPWVQATERAPFWLAIDPYGSMRSQIHGARPTYFVSNDRATVTPLARRPPEQHPAKIGRVMVPIRLKRTGTGILTPWRQPKP